jgi:catechol 2,3-dioxygenase-like lactoylglutathione lyase family enzyme
MNIVGPDELHFGVPNIETCRTFLLDYGLTDAGNHTYEARDGTCIVLRDVADPTLPAPLASGNKLRKTVYGVADPESLEEIAEELSRDRQVTREADGSISAVDDVGFALGFRLTRRRPLQVKAELINTPGISAGRPLNQLGVDPADDIAPLTLSHVVYFVPDQPKMEAFYAERLKFRVVDRFLGMGPFMSPLGSSDHHTLFLIQTPAYMQGVEHLAFHMRGPSALMLAGYALRAKGYETFWGPGRHKFGSNWFWYFKSPLGCAMEFDADMDRLGDGWIDRVLPGEPENAQAFLLQAIDKWAPGGGPPDEAH